MVPKSCPEIDMEFVYFLGGLLGRFGSPSTLKNKQNEWSVCTDHSFGLFSFSMFFISFCIKNGTVFGGKTEKKSIKNRAQSQDVHQRRLGDPFGDLLAPLETLSDPPGLPQDIDTHATRRQGDGEGPILEASSPQGKGAEAT